MVFTAFNKIFILRVCHFLSFITWAVLFVLLKLILTSKRMFFLIVVERKTPDVGLIWFAAVCLKAHPQN